MFAAGARVDLTIDLDAGRWTWDGEACCGRGSSAECARCVYVGVGGEDVYDGESAWRYVLAWSASCWTAWAGSVPGM